MAWWITTLLCTILYLTDGTSMPFTNDTARENRIDLSENTIDDSSDTELLKNDCEDSDCRVQRNNSTSNVTHAPLFGFIPRECPSDPLPELFPIRKCTSDQDCWPRICCIDDNEINGFCRIAIPIWDRMPMPRIVSPLKTAMAYWQCTPPPPPTYDLFPKPCRSTFDCFPNLCCQEKDKKVCRPPKKSILTLISTFAQQRESWFG